MKLRVRSGWRLRPANAGSRQGASAYDFSVDRGSYPWRLDFGPALAQLVADRSRGADVSTLAARFHQTVAEAVAALAAELCEARGLSDIALSGGVFQNVTLLTALEDRLRAAGLTVYSNCIVPPNDGGVSLGQAAVAVAREKTTCA